MRVRCSNPKQWTFKYYGGKGVRVCDAWHDFAVFRDWAASHGYADGLTIELINPEGNYDPANCEWITASENSRRMAVANAQKRKKAA